MTTTEFEITVKKNLAEFEYSLKKNCSETTVNDFLDHLDFVVKLSSGGFVTYYKPKIETSLCFGYSDDIEGQDRRRAYNMVDKAKTDGGEIFKAHNLRDITKKIRIIKNNRHYGIAAVAECATQGSIHFIVPREEAEKYYNHKDWHVLSETDIDQVLKGYELQTQHFEKRLNSYLKRYGTSKLKTWSYWLDA